MHARVCACAARGHALTCVNACMHMPCVSAHARELKHARACAGFCAVLPGGLGDVMSALPKGLRRRGHRMMVVVPKYGDYKEARDTGARARFNNFNSSQEVRMCARGWVCGCGCECRCLSGPMCHAPSLCQVCSSCPPAAPNQRRTKQHFPYGVRVPEWS